MTTDGNFKIVMTGELIESGTPVESEIPVDPGEAALIRTWDDAIRKAWECLGYTGDGWKSAVITDPHGVVVRLDAADKQALRATRIEGYRREDARIAAEKAAHPERNITIGGDDD